MTNGHDMEHVGWCVVLRHPCPFEPPVTLFLIDREERARDYAAHHDGIIRPIYSPKETPCATPSSPPF